MIDNALLDVDFINNLLCQTEREVFARITVLTQKEEPIEFIEGKATGGNINVDGKSAIRRSCSLTMVAEDVYINEFYWGLKNKFKFEVGLKNNVTDKYENIIWFPQGIYVITNFDTSVAAKKWTISIKGKDKMCLLNGEFGGNLPHNNDFGIVWVMEKDGTKHKEPIDIHTIVSEAVRNYGSELPSNIIINDLENVGVELLEYRGNTPMYMFRKEEDDIFTNMTFNGNQPCYYWSTNGWTKTTLNDNENIIYDNLVDLDGENEPTKVKLHEKMDQLYYVAKFDYGSVPGYRLTDLTYPNAENEALKSKVGDTVVSMLNKIVKMLGDFEFFYNLEGKFVFQKKKKYNAFNWHGVEESEVLYSDATLNMEKPIFSLLDNKLITSFKNSPKIANLKNDYAIWGMRHSPSGAENPIYARYAIDEKPIYYKSFDGVYYIADRTLLEEIKENLKKDAISIVQNTISAYEPTYGIHNSLLDKPVKKPNGSWTAGWWDIRDWAEFYKLLTGTTVDPPYTMKWYSRNDHTGYQALYSDKWGYSDTSYKYSDTLYVWLIIETPGGVWNPQHGSSDTQPDSTKQYKCTKWESYLDEEGNIHTSRSSPAEYKNFMMPYAGCTDSHTYLAFLKNDIERDGNKVYFYNPDFPAANFEDLVIDRIDDEFNKLLNSGMIQFVDWREIIYRMSVDYQNHYHEDDFLYKVAQNNIDYYPSGQTGYERYYIDMYEKWRFIYNPDATPLFDIISYTEAPEHYRNETLYIQHSYRKLEMDEKDELTVDINKLYVLDKTRCDSLDDVPSHPDIVPFLGSKYCKLEDGYDLYFYVGEDNVMNSGEIDHYKLNQVNLADIYLKNRGPFITNETAFVQDTSVNKNTYVSGKYYVQSKKAGYYLYNGTYDASLSYYVEDSSTVDGYKKVKIGREKYEPGKYYELQQMWDYDSETGSHREWEEYLICTDNKWYEDGEYYKLLDATFVPVSLDYNTYEEEKYYIVDSTSIDENGYIKIEYRICLDSEFDSNLTYYRAENPKFTLIKLGEYGFETNKFFTWQEAQYQVYEGSYNANLTYYSPSAVRKHYYVKGPQEDSGLNGESKYQYWVFKYPFGTAVGEYYDDYTNYAALQLEKYLETYGWDNLYIKTDGHIKFQDLDQDIQRLYYKQGGILAEYLTMPQYDNYNQMKTNKTEITYSMYEMYPSSYPTIEGYKEAIQKLQEIYINSDDILDDEILNSIYQLKEEDFDDEYDFREALRQAYNKYLDLIYKRYTEILMEEILTYEQVHYKRGYYEFNRDGENGNYWTKLINTSPEELIFWFDFVNGKTSHLSKYSIQAIGPRSKSVNDKDVKAIYYKEIPDTIFITSQEEKEKYEYQTGYTYIQLNQGMESLFSISTKGKSAKEAFEDLLYTHSYATETATIQAAPVYHLQPNTCIYIRNDDTNIDGEYLISKLTIPLDHKKMMSITATKVVPSIT